MKKTFTIFLFAIVMLTSNAFSQSFYWNIINFGTYENLNAVHCPDASTVYIGGNQGKVYKSINAGNTFTLKTFPNNGNIASIYFLNSLTGFAGSQAGLFKTTDGAETWTQVTMPSNYLVVSISFSSASVGWIGDWWGNILKTTNGGDNWTQINLMNGYLAKVFFINDFTGWAVDSYGNVRRTTNGGINFTQSRISYDTLSAVRFVSSNIGYISGDSGKVIKTTNGGANWQLTNTGILSNLYGLHVVTPMKLYACGDDGNIISSDDGGNYWNIDNPVTIRFNAIAFPQNTSSGIAVGNSGVVAQRVSTPGIFCIGSGVNRTGYPFYTYYMDSRTEMLYLNSEITSNGGSPNGVIYKIGFVIDSAYAPQTMNEFSIRMKNTTATSVTGFSEVGWTTAYTGNYAINGLGSFYIDLTTPFNYTAGNNVLIDICFNNSSYTTNSYINSSVMPGMTYHGHQDLVSGAGCCITAGTAYNLRPNICFETAIITSGNNGQTLTPKEFSLSQNYPNPFNPVTKINYDVPKKAFVTLKIYDMLGREVSTLVNETKSPAKYTIDFNASNLSSGIYFYQMTADNKLIGIKKMIVVK